MLIPNIAASVVYSYTGVTEFPIPFPFYELTTIIAGHRKSSDPTDLSPYVPLVYGTDYSVTGERAANDDSEQAYTDGKLTLTPVGQAKLELGFALIIMRQTPIEQQYAYNELDDFPAKSHENALGRLAVIAQELQEGVARSLQMPLGATAAGQEVLAEILVQADVAKEAAERAEEAADRAEEAADTINPDNFVAIDNKQWAMDAIGLPTYGAKEALKHVRVNEEGTSLEYVDLEHDPVLSGGNIRNIILAGRQKNGLPAFLVTHEQFDQRHQPGYNVGKAGDCSASSYYDGATGTYGPAGLWANQQVYSGYYYNTAYLTTDQVVDLYYTFKEPHVFTGIYLAQMAASQEPKTVEILGRNSDADAWTSIMPASKMGGYLANLDLRVTKDAGKTYWFTDNATAYSQMCIRMVRGNGTVIQMKTARFYEAPPATGIGPRDAVLLASLNEPFKASIAGGIKGDQIVTLTADVKIPGSILTEFSRNYIMLVPENEDGSCPDYVDATKAIYLASSHAYLVPSLRKINYGTEDALEYQTALLLQPQDTTSRTLSTAENLLGYFDKRGTPITATNLTIDATQHPSGAPAVYKFPYSTSSWIRINFGYDLESPQHTQAGQTGMGTRMGSTWGQDWEMECDVSYTGPADSDEYRIMFDFGHYQADNSFAIQYSPRRRNISLHGYSGGQQTCIPANMNDGAFHKFKIGCRNRKIYMYLDGKCLGFYDNTDFRYPYYNYFMVGRWIDSSSGAWDGAIGNIRVTNGDCLHQKEDYTPDAVFDTRLIPTGKRWWDSVSGVVRTRTATGWVDTPMLCIGHIDTGSKEHLLTNEPYGCYRGGDSDMPNLIKNITSSGNYDSNYPAKAVCNYYEGGSYPWLTPANNNTTTHWVMLEFEQAMAFEEIRFHNTRAEWYRNVCLFNLKVSDDAAVWDTLIDRHLFVDDGALQYYYNNTYPGGSSYNPEVCAIKAHTFSQDTPKKYLMVELPPKKAVPYYADSQTTALRFHLILKGAMPEIQRAQSYVIGSQLEIGPVFIKVSAQFYNLIAPFGGADIDVKGYTVDRNDWKHRKYPLQYDRWRNTDGNDYTTGVLASYDADSNTVNILTGNYYINYYQGGYWGAPDTNSTASQADLYLILRRVS